MKVTMLSLAAGPDYVARPGDTIDVPAEVAAAMVAGGHAVASGPEAEAEVAAAPPSGERGELKSRSSRS